MNKPGKHISLVLLLIFILPIGYQTWHLLDHAANRNVHDTVADKSAKNNAVLDNSGGSLHCAICDYEFCVSQVSYKFWIPSVFFRYVMHELFMIISFPQVFSINRISQRAPPFIFLSYK